MLCLITQAPVAWVADALSVAAAHLLSLHVAPDCCTANRFACLPRLEQRLLFTRLAGNALELKNMTIHCLQMTRYIHISLRGQTAMYYIYDELGTDAAVCAHRLQLTVLEAGQQHLEQHASSSAIQCSHELAIGTDAAGCAYCLQLTVLEAGQQHLEQYASSSATAATAPGRRCSLSRGKPIRGVLHVKLQRATHAL
jgi:hypothetical protein